MKQEHGPGALLRRRSLHEDVTEALREMIVSGELALGQKIPERELCEAYGVSRTPLREALKVLATDGLVTLEPNRGAWVSQITIEDLDEVFPVLGALEALAGDLACRNARDAEIEDIRKLHEEMLKRYEARDLDRYFTINRRIHEAILVAARNETLVTHYSSLAARVTRSRYIASMTAERWQRAVEEHEEIMRALEARDGPRLAAILRAHLENKRATVRDWLMAQQAAE